MIRSLRVLVLALSGSSILVFVYLGLRRLVYPLELDYIEGVMMDHVVRLAQGKPIYVAPALEFVPLAYMPGFATAASLLARLFGPGFWEPRLISLLAMLATAALVARIVRAETGQWTYGAAGAGVLLAAYGVTGGHYDVGRPDSLMLFLALAGLATLRFTNGMAGALGSAVLLSLAFFTKQHAAWFSLAALAHLAFNDRRRILPFALGLALGCGGGYALLVRWLGPWFPFFTWEVPTHWSQIDRLRILNYLGRGCLGSIAALTLPSLLSLALPERPWRGRSGLWMWAGLGAIGTGLMATLDPDAFRHVMNPTVVIFSVLGPFSLARLSVHLAAWPGSQREGRTAVGLLVLSLQFIPLVYGIHEHMPHARAGEARAQLLERIRSYPGPVLMFYHGFYGWSAGKRPMFQQITLDDVIRARGNSLLRRDPRYFDRIFDRLRHGADRPMIITDIALEKTGSESNALWASIAGSYRLAEELGWISAALDPVNGNHWTPRYVYLPRPDMTGGEAGSSGDSSAAMAEPPAAAAPRAAFHR